MPARPVPNKRMVIGSGIGSGGVGVFVIGGVMVGVSVGVGVIVVGGVIVGVSVIGGVIVLVGVFLPRGIKNKSGIAPKPKTQ